MMKKVVKFGGSSLASPEQFKKVKRIVTEEEVRRYVIPSAPGKRYAKDTKVTDLLYQCYDMAEQGKDFLPFLKKIQDRFDEIIRGLGLQLSLQKEFQVIAEQFQKKAGSDYAASRGEYLNGRVLAEYLGFEFVDAADLILFGEDGAVLLDESGARIRACLGQKEYAVIPGYRHPFGVGCKVPGAVGFLRPHLHGATAYEHHAVGCRFGP